MGAFGAPRQSFAAGALGGCSPLSLQQNLVLGAQGASAVLRFGPAVSALPATQPAACLQAPRCRAWHPPGSAAPWGPLHPGVRCALGSPVPWGPLCPATVPRTRWHATEAHQPAERCDLPNRTWQLGAVIIKPFGSTRARQARRGSLRQKRGFLQLWANPSTSGSTGWASSSRRVVWEVSLQPAASARGSCQILVQQ